MDKLISIIVPVYNSQSFLSKCIDTLIDQTYKNIEIILIDDCSCDSSLNICYEYEKKDSRIKVYKNDINMGPCKTREKGISIAKGDYYGFVDSDDYIENTMYEYLAYILIKNNADISVCGHNIVKDGKIIEKVHCDNEEILLNKTESLEAIINDKIINSFFGDKLYKKEVFKNIEFKDIIYHEDIATVFKLFYNANSVILGNKPMYNYVRNNNSICLTLNPQKTYCSFLAYLERYNFSKKNNLSIINKTTTDMSNAAVASLNMFIRNNLFEINSEEIDVIRNTIKLNIMTILFVSKCNLTSKLYCTISIISMRLYKFICNLNINKKKGK